MTTLLFETCIPLAALIALGYVLAKFQTIDLKSVASLAIFAITPVAAFGAAAQMDFSPSVILLPIMTFCLAAIVGLSSFALGKVFLKNDNSKCLLPMACGSGNTGYFGLPVVAALFGVESIGIYFLGNLGVVIFETTIGYYFIARGNATSAEAIRRVVRLPVIYALATGLIFAAMAIDLPSTFIKLWDLDKAAFVVVGMMIAGIALAHANSFRINPGLTVVAFIGKFLIWPSVALLFGWLDPVFDDRVHQLVLILSLMPVAANLPAYAAIAGAKVQEAAMLVLISTVLVIALLPFILPLLMAQP